jgi:hypothetical protein
MARNIQLRRNAMAIPLIAAGIAARAIASKLATRAVGGIVGAGAKTVAPVYRNSPSVKVVNIKQEAKELSEFTGEKISKKTYQNIVNDGNTMMRNRDKSGQSAKEVAQWQTAKNKSIPKKPTVKINSNMRAR